MAGYDLTSLFMGFKGTLGFLTQAMLHLHPHPLPEASAATAFPSTQAVMDCTMQVLQTIAFVVHIGGCQGMVLRLGVWVLVTGLMLSPSSQSSWMR